MKRGNAEQKGGLELVYREVTDYSINAVAGYISVLKVIDPLQGVLYPEQYLPVAQSCNQCCELSGWALDTAGRDIVHLQSKDVYFDWMSVYVPVRSFVQESFADRVKNTFSSLDAPLNKLVLELPEEILYVQDENISGNLALLRAEGVRFMLSGFGGRMFPLLALLDFHFEFYQAGDEFLSLVLSAEEDHSDAVKMACAIAAAPVILQGISAREQISACIANGFYLLQANKLRKISGIK